MRYNKFVQIFNSYFIKAQEIASVNLLSKNSRINLVSFFEGEGKTTIMPKHGNDKYLFDDATNSHFVRSHVGVFLPVAISVPTKMTILLCIY